MINRRRFMQSLAVASAAPINTLAQSNYSPLKPDPDGIIDLPEGWQYTVVARKGEEMDDGLVVPGFQDGMAAFAGEAGQIILVCNHEIYAHQSPSGAFGQRAERLGELGKRPLYDNGSGKTPGLGGTTTIHYDPRSRERTHMHMSLLGTEVNCAGGPTPWGSWLSCEECFIDPGTSFQRGHVVHREKKHGYIFEVSAHDMEAVEPVPLTQMGRFEHEAAAVDPVTGIVYLTEDQHRGLLYRYLPNVPGKLHEGGRLQALGIKERDKFDTRNWSDPNAMPVGTWFETRWVDLEEPDVANNDLRLRGAEMGAAVFARGEGVCYADGEIVMTATIGGPQRLGQVFSYEPSPAEGHSDERSKPGKIKLLAQSSTDSVLRHADNIVMSPWGDLVVCEDTAKHCGLVGIRPDGYQYPIADNAHSRSELAGACFSPDGNIMFVNIQVNGITLAITGPWSA
jgi:secreted PhoX family phosphatase